MSPSLTLAVIGHVNHGKTALVHALTGMKTDRLKEEIERGLSITLGFAWRDYSSGGVDFIDTPGHEDFIRAMVAGATGARAVLLVVSATEGFGRQTGEHLRIAALLGISAGVVALTKADLIPPEGEDAVRADVAVALRDTFMVGAPVVLCSSVTGKGLAELHEHLRALAGRRSSAEHPSGVFLPIDRAFTVNGTGAVVTGTLQGGPLKSGSEAVLEPSGRRVGLRRIQVHGAAVGGAEPGGRVAVSLRGVSTDQIRAGDVLCAPGAFASTLQVDALVTVAADGSRPIKHMDELRVMWGARSDVATARLIGAASIAPGAQGLARLQFSTPVIAFAGQRAVLRRLSPAETIGGALVLDPAAAPYRGRPAGRLAVLEAALAGDPERIAACLARQDGGIVSVAEVARLSRRGGVDVRRRLDMAFKDLDGVRLVMKAAVAEAEKAYLDDLAADHRRAPARASVSAGSLRGGLARRASRDLIAHVERALVAAGKIRLDGSRVALAGHDPFASLSVEAVDRIGRIETALRDGGLTPPDTALSPGAEAEDQDLRRILIDSGRVVALRNVALRQTLVFHADALREAFEMLRAAFPPGSEFTTGEARAALGATRKFIVPVLEHFDAEGLTARDGNVRRVIGAPARTDA